MYLLGYLRSTEERKRKVTVELMTEKLLLPGWPCSAASALSAWLAVKNGKTGYCFASAHSRRASRYCGSSSGVGISPTLYG